MTGAEIVKALGGRWHGRQGHAVCPAHKDRNPSLAIREHNGKLLLHCHAGCGQADVLDALKARGLWPDGSDLRGGANFHGRTSRRREVSKAAHGPDFGPDARKRTAAALEIWREAQPAAGTHVETYLRSRGIVLPVPPSLRYAPALVYTPSGITLPCMVAGVQAPDRSIIAIHRTYLKGDGTDKAHVSTPKMALGPLGAGAVRLGAAAETLGLAEGIETALSAMQLFDLPVWAALGSRLAAVELPPAVKRVVIFADRGEAGLKAANDALTRYTRERRKVAIKVAPIGSDWNDALRQGRAA